MLNKDYKEMLQSLLGFLSRKNLKNKLATGRKKDRLDAEYLKEA